MRIRQFGRKRIAMLVALTALGAVSTLWVARQAPAGPMRQVASGLVGITTGQAARFHVVNVGETRGMVIDGGRFFDADGRLLAECGQQMLALGQAFSCELSRADVGGRTEDRVEVHAVVSLTGRLDDVVATLEVVGLEDGQSRMGWNNHNETLVRDPATARQP